MIMIVSNKYQSIIRPYISAFDQDPPTDCFRDDHVSSFSILSWVFAIFNVSLLTQFTHCVLKSPSKCVKVKIKPAPNQIIQCRFCVLIQITAGYGRRRCPWPGFQPQPR